MSTPAAKNKPAATATAAKASGEPTVVVRHWGAPIAFTAFTALSAILFVVFGRDGVSTLGFATEKDFFQLPAVEFPVRGTGVAVTVLLAVGSAVAWFLAVRARRLPAWASFLFGVTFLLGFLTWASAGASLPMTGLLLGSVSLSVPLVFGALGGVIGERVGVVNVAIEGQLLGGAFLSALVATVTGSPYAGLVAAMVAGVLVALVLAVFSIKYIVDQVIVGVVLNVLVAGLTSFLFSKVLSPNPDAFNKPERLPRIEIPVLNEIPVIGPVLFRQTIIVYIMYAAVALVWWGLFRSRWGLRLRAVGEHPKAADTVGIKVNKMRFWNVTLAGAIAGFGGAYFTLGSVGAFGKEMTAGAGFIALAAVIFGKWNPVRAALAGLLFGFATNLQSTLSVIGSPVPSQFMLMLPYVVTLFAVVGFVGQSRGPAAAGKPYLTS